MGKWDVPKGNISDILISWIVFEGQLVSLLLKSMAEYVLMYWNILNPFHENCGKYQPNILILTEILGTLGLKLYQHV